MRAFYDITALTLNSLVTANSLDIDVHLNDQNDSIDDSTSDEKNINSKNNETADSNDATFYTIISKFDTIFFLTIDNIEVYLRAKDADQSIKTYSLLSRKTHNEDWRSFQSKVNYAFAHWMHRFRLLNETIDKLFQDSRMKSLYNLANFNSVMSLKELIHSIENSTCNEDFISMSEWTRDEFEILSYKAILVSMRHKILYRDVLKLIRFMIDHSSFISNLIYALIRQWNSNNNLIWNELHIED